MSMYLFHCPIFQNLSTVKKITFSVYVYCRLTTERKTDRKKRNILRYWIVFGEEEVIGNKIGLTIVKRTWHSFVIDLNKDKAKAWPLKFPLHYILRKELVLSDLVKKAKNWTKCVFDHFRKERSIHSQVTYLRTKTEVQVSDCLWKERTNYLWVTWLKTRTEEKVAVATSGRDLVKGKTKKKKPTKKKLKQIKRKQNKTRLKAQVTVLDNLWKELTYFLWVT